MLFFGVIDEHTRELGSAKQGCSGLVVDTERCCSGAFRIYCADPLEGLLADPAAHSGGLCPREIAMGVTGDYSDGRKGNRAGRKEDRSRVRKSPRSLHTGG